MLARTSLLRAVGVRAGAPAREYPRRRENGLSGEPADEQYPLDRHWPV